MLAAFKLTALVGSTVALVREVPVAVILAAFLDASWSLGREFHWALHPLAVVVGVAGAEVLLWKVDQGVQFAGILVRHSVRFSIGGNERFILGAPGKHPQQNKRHDGNDVDGA